MKEWLVLLVMTPSSQQFLWLYCKTLGRYACCNRDFPTEIPFHFGLESTCGVIMILSTVSSYGMNKFIATVHVLGQIHSDGCRVQIDIDRSNSGKK